MVLVTALAQHLLSSMRAAAKQENVRLSDSITQRYCASCSSFLMPVWPAMIVGVAAGSELRHESAVMYDDGLPLVLYSSDQLSYVPIQSTRA